MGAKNISVKNRDTYVYIDVSNIRWACVKTLGFYIDFVKLLNYFKDKYPNLKEVRYYEGIAKGDLKKRKMFNFLRKKGYTICPLERKAYSSAEIDEHGVKCPRCGYMWTTKFARERRAMKSNVDVYLASDMVARAILADYPIRIILVSCDGDYAEAIKSMIKLNKNVSVRVLATPFVKEINKNTLSVRLKKLRNELPKTRYMLNDIRNIAGRISGDE